MPMHVARASMRERIHSMELKDLNIFLTNEALRGIRIHSMELKVYDFTWRDVWAYVFGIHSMELKVKLSDLYQSIAEATESIQWN